MALYENVIEKILKKDEKTKKIYLGTYARDELPTNFNFPCCFILNTEPRESEGGHWLAFYYNSRGFCHFFDSFGNNPEYFNLKSFIQNSSNYWTWNKNRLQGSSVYCGYYCILYLLFISRDSEKSFFENFSLTNFDLNDFNITKLILKYS